VTTGAPATTAATGPAARGPLQLASQVLGTKRLGPYVAMTLMAPGLPERFRPGAFLAVAVGGPSSELLLRRSLPIFRVRASGAYGGTVEVVFPVTDSVTGSVTSSVTDRGTDWLSRCAPGTPLDVIGPLGRPFALPREAVTCTLAGVGAAGAPLFALADRLRERGCEVHLVLGAADQPHLFGALEARRAGKTVTVTTEDGSVGIKGTALDVLPELLDRTGSDVVYASGTLEMLHGVAAAAEAHGAWSQTLVGEPMPCGTGVCLGCTLPVVGEDGISRRARACVEGPVFRGDRVRWDDLGGPRLHTTEAAAHGVVR
jgi:dihydroorotate dehydrogenase electron transfer subunit